MVVKQFQKNLLFFLMVFFIIQTGGVYMERLKKWKEQKKVLKYTNQDIATKAKLPLRTVEQIMCGKVKAPRLDTVEAIEKALELSEWNEEDYKNGVINEKPVSITADDEEILDKFHEVKKAIGEQGKVLIIEFCNAILSKFKM